MISDELEKTLQRAKKIAESFNHEYMTIEHLLFSMISQETSADFRKSKIGCLVL